MKICFHAQITTVIIIYRHKYFFDLLGIENQNVLHFQKKLSILSAEHKYENLPLWKIDAEKGISPLIQIMPT